ncbi:MAG TPA: hypothetical protein VFU69_05770 [Ktedonobacterales bacterium]|nr:hypothetical protein [Ktedonobacterales bacterium]
MRYAKIALGLGVFAVCVVVGVFIPIGGGSAVLIGAVVGLVLCYLVLSQKRFWSGTSGASGDVDERAISQKTLGMHEAHAYDSIVMDQLRDPHN